MNGTCGWRFPPFSQRQFKRARTKLARPLRGEGKLNMRIGAHSRKTIGRFFASGRRNAVYLPSGPNPFDVIATFGRMISHACSNRLPWRSSWSRESHASVALVVMRRSRRRFWFVRTGLLPGPAGVSGPIFPSLAASTLTVMFPFHVTIEAALSVRFR